MTSESLALGPAAGRVAVKDIEAELRRLWRESAKGGESAVTRACLLTLVALAADEAEHERVARAARAAAARHPARVLLVLAMPGDASGRMDAEVNAYCTIAGRGRKQVCHEDVTIDARGAAVARIPSAVRPLLVPDLPVVLYLPSDRLAGDPATAALADVADRVVLDSAVFSPAAIRRLLDAGVTVSDLAFGRTLPWRRAVAALFDEVTSVADADVTSVADAGGAAATAARGLTAARVAGANPEAALLAAWISERTGVAASVDLTDGPRIRSVALDGATARFRVDLEGGALVAAIDAPGACRPWSEPYAEPDEAALLEAEIARAAADPIATRAVERALTLLGTGR